VCGGGPLSAVLEQEVDEPGVAVDEPFRERGVGGLQKCRAPLFVGDDELVAVEPLLDEASLGEPVGVPRQRAPGDPDAVDVADREGPSSSSVATISPLVSRRNSASAARSQSPYSGGK